MRALPGALRRGLLFMFSPCCLKFPSAPPSSPGLSELYRLLYDKVPYRARFRSDNYAAVLRLQNTQPKDRRVYDDPYRNPCNAEGPHGRTGLKPDGKILRAAGSM